MACKVVRACAASIALALGGVSVCAQSLQSANQNSRGTTQDAYVDSDARNSRITSLLEQLADQSRSSDNLSFAVRAQSQAATLLWPHNSERARAIYRRAFQSLVDSP